MNFLEGRLANDETVQLMFLAVRKADASNVPPVGPHPLVSSVAEQRVILHVGDARRQMRRTVDVELDRLPCVLVRHDLVRDAVDRPVGDAIEPRGLACGRQDADRHAVEIAQSRGITAGMQPAQRGDARRIDLLERPVLPVDRLRKVHAPGCRVRALSIERHPNGASLEIDGHHF